MKKVLVTGGAGYIGSLLVDRLLNDGYYVRVLDSLYFKQNSLDSFCYHENFEFIHGDVRDKETLSLSLRDMDFIFPLACLVGAPLCDKFPEEAQSVNYDSIELLISLLESNQKIIYPTTNSGYGTQSGEQYCTEDTPLEPISLYGRTKVESEKIILNYKNSVTLRLATVFGSSFRTRFDLLVNDFTFKAVTENKLVIYEGHFKRNFIHIRDAIDCFIFTIENYESMKGNCFNLGLDEANISKIDLAELIKEEIPTLEIITDEFAKDPDKRNYIVSNDKIKSKGFEAKRSLRDGIKEMVKVTKMTINRTQNI
jgi:nucleoside-diphosphate-sugar epimerase